MNIQNKQKTKDELIWKITFPSEANADPQRKINIIVDPMH